MVSYRYLGSALTNANGVATFDYQGTGAGEIDVIASLDNPITDGSIVSEIFPVFDYFLYDSGVTGTKNPNVTVGTNVTEQVTSNGTVLTCTNGTSLATAQYTYTKVIGGDFEAYVTLTTPSSILMGFYGGSDSARISISNVENRTYKFKRTGSNWIVQYYDGSEWVDLSFYNNTLGNKDCRFYLYLYSDNETDTITFKDVKVTVEDSLNIGGDSIVQTGDTIGITGKFYESGIPVKNIDLDIYKNGVKVDTVNTGSTGVALYSYGGSGVGEVNFQYKYGSFVSETFSVWDTLIYDSGINDGHKNTNVTLGTNVTEQVLDDGTVLECTNGTSLVNAQYTYNQQISGDFEAIITVTASSAIRIGFLNGSNSARIQVSNVSNRQYKLSRIGTEWTAQYWNGTQWVVLSYWDAKTLTDEDCKFYFYLYSANETRSVKFTDLKIYSI